MKRAVITGPTGEVGLSLVNELIENNIEVLAVVRPGSARAARLPKSEKVTVIENELENLSLLPNLIDGRCDVFYHLAWEFSRDHDNVDKQYNNIGYTINAVRVANEIGCESFIGAGSQAEYGIVNERITPDTKCNPVIAYGMAKLCSGLLSRKLAKQIGVKHIWPRIISVYGPGDAESAMIPSVIRSLLSGGKPSLTKGEQEWDFLYSRDCARAMRLIAEKGKDGSVYCIGHGETKPLREYIEIIRDEINPSLPLGIGEIPYGKNQVMRLDVDISALVEDTGFTPIYDFRTGIRETIEWCRNNDKALKQEEVLCSLS